MGDKLTHYFLTYSVSNHIGLWHAHSIHSDYYAYASIWVNPGLRSKTRPASFVVDESFFSALPDLPAQNEGQSVHHSHPEARK